MLLYALNKDEGLIQIKWLEKVPHIEMRNIAHTDRPSHWSN